ncbi:MAG: hypothetical protein ACI8QS_003435 [Planctomycetota bacterium]|jgi:hypothetical protein
MQAHPLLIAFGLSLCSCVSAELDLSDLESPVMLNSYGPKVSSEETPVEASFAYTGTASKHNFIHGFNGGGSRIELVNDAQESAFELVGGTEEAGITNVEIHLRSSSTYPLLWISQYIEIKALGAKREDQ